MNAAHPIAVMEPRPFLHQLVSAGRYIEKADGEAEQVEAVLDLVNLLLARNLEADAHNPLLEAKGMLESNLTELCEERVNDTASAYADWFNDCRRNDDGSFTVGV